MAEALVILLLAILAGRLAGPWIDRDDRRLVERATAALASPWAAWIVGAITGATVWFAWGHWNPTPIVHDEAAYLLQTRTFALGRLANPAPPLAQFFEQFHVLVTPTFSAKYPPGAALAFVPGIWLGLPALMPVLFAAATGTLIFLLARRLTNPWVALVAWMIWITAPPTLDHASSFFSENVSGPLVLAGWWALLEWTSTRRLGWLVALSVGTAWMAISRPFTAVAYAIPAATVVLATAWRHRAWRSVAIAAIAGVVVLGLIPLTNRAVLGEWRATPWGTYSKEYMPWDRLGFGFDATPPLRPLPDDMRVFAQYFDPVYGEHVAAKLPQIFLARGRAVLGDIFGGRRQILLSFAAIGLVGASLATGIAATSLVLVLALYLAYGHAANWTLYYAEFQPVLAFLAALGLWRVATLATGAAFPRERIRDRAVSARAVVATAVMVALSMPHAIGMVSLVNRLKRRAMAHQREFFQATTMLPTPRSIVFVRYMPKHNVHRSLIANEPDLASAPVWIVYDRGAENLRLMRAAPDRTAYLFDEASGMFAKLPPFGTRG